MPWFKVDDGFWSHPKVIDLPASAGWLWLRAGCYSSQHLTDGLVKTSTLRMLGAETTDADALVEAGLWDSKPDGYEFHDWERYQPPSSTSKAKRDELSQKRAEAGKKGADSRWQKAGQPDSNADGKLLSSSDGKPMAPSRPVPSTPKGVAQKRETTLPDGWKPNENCVTFAEENRLAVAFQAEQFKARALADGKKFKDWDAAFRYWLGNAVKWRAPGEGTPAKRGMTVAELEAHREKVMRDAG